MIYNGPNEEFFEILSGNTDQIKPNDIKNKEALTLIWFTDDHSSIKVDTQHIEMRHNQIMCLTPLHHIEKIQSKSCQILRFNKPFYCILDHDNEISCKGLLYFGASTIPTLIPNTEELTILQAAWKMLALEMQHTDNLQLEMLQMMLKRILILCTRVYKRQHLATPYQEEKTDLLRDFNFLVEQHFRIHHTVAEYARLLHKSPKTISNSFKKLETLSPLRHIQNRILLEAKRLLFYSKDSISDISDELGFNDIQSFSRFFKNKAKLSPQTFRKNAISGKIDKP